MAKLRSTQTCLRDPRVSTKRVLFCRRPDSIRREQGGKPDGFHGLRERLIPPPYPFPLANKGCGTGWSAGTSRSGQRKSFNGWPASELFEARDADSRGDSPRSRRAKGCARRTAPVKPSAPGPSLDGQRERIGVANPVRCWRSFRPDALRSARRRQATDPPEEPALGDHRGREPGVGCLDRVTIGAADRQPTFVPRAS
jgi:hypothetical protein